MSIYIIMYRYEYTCMDRLIRLPIVYVYVYVYVSVYVCVCLCVYVCSGACCLSELRVLCVQRMREKAERRYHKWLHLYIHTYIHIIW